MPNPEYVLEFENLSVTFATEFGYVEAVKNMSLGVKPGEIVALVGESGSGKSVTSMTALGLSPRNAEIDGATYVVGKNVTNMSQDKVRRMRGSDVAMIFQEPMTALNPVLRVGDQVMEALSVHGVAHGKQAEQRAIELLDMVGIPDADKRFREYPHQFSGGQRQRIVIAIAIACGPKVIIADEPTTALDVTVQAEILDLMRSLKDKLNTGILLITHNMGVVADMADRVAVMLKGSKVEEGPIREVLKNPQHPYTKKLLASVPHLGESELKVAEPERRDGVDRLALKTQGLCVDYVARGKRVRAVHDANIEIAQGEIVGLVGESGSGKSTIAKAVLGLLPVAEGELLVHGNSLTSLRGAELKAARKRIGAVFQDPAASLDPRFPIGDLITEPMVIHKVGDKKSRLDRAYELLDAVRLPRSVVNRFPHELSGGQRQRISIARALVLNPDLLIADEPTSALDVSVQASVLEMFAELQREFNFACLFVSHDLAVIDMLAHRVAVMRNGRIVEQGLTSTVLHNPRELYTQELLAAAPVPDPDEQAQRRAARHELVGATELGDGKLPGTTL
ncbi:ABC transporter ATP-binding protein [Micrococcoides hystricis]|uniref:ABC transporter ATP-binding protein n=1 Tax=Micrococcoides hystricis TaxID=1572761 RepID=A0ABV6PAI1_9MICC